jgi:hypothetical protein
MGFDSSAKVLRRFLAIADDDSVASTGGRLIERYTRLLLAVNAFSYLSNLPIGLLSHRKLSRFGIAVWMVFQCCAAILAVLRSGDAKQGWFRYGDELIHVNTAFVCRYSINGMYVQLNIANLNFVVTHVTFRSCCNTDPNNNLGSSEIWFMRQIAIFIFRHLSRSVNRQNNSNSFRYMSTRTYEEAIEHLNSLQSNAATLEAVRASGGRMSELAIPEMVEYLGRIGYHVCAYIYRLLY